MALNIKNAEVERLWGEMAGLAGETETEAIPRALEKRRWGWSDAARSGR